VITRKEPVVAELGAHLERDQQRRRESQGKSEQVDGRLPPVAQQIATGGRETIRQHAG
jgi:hypothetical protein